MDIQLLRKVGLTDGESKVYLALLELGSSTTGPIVKEADIAKSIVYQILDRLIQKGLVSYIVKEKTKYFQAGDPRKILGLIDEKETDLKEIKNEFEKVLPELLSKQLLKKKSEAIAYLGFRGVRTTHEHIYDKLKRGEEYYYLGIPAYQPEEQHIYWKRDHIQRIKAGIKCKFLYNKDAHREILKDRNSYKGCEARYMPTDIKTPATFLIYKDTVAIILQSPKYIAIEIINEDITNSFKAYFDEFWKQSVPFK